MPSNAGPPSAGDVAPWQHPDLLPLNPLGDEWGAFLHGEIEPRSVESMVADFRKIPEEVESKGEAETVCVAFVAEPGKERLLPVAESSTFRPIILEMDAQTLLLVRLKNGRLFLILAAICGAAVLMGFGQAAVLPAIFAAQFGSAYFEAYFALRRLRTDPDSYLENLAAELRHAYWHGIAGDRGMARTLTMGGAWVVLAIVQCIAGVRGTGGSFGIEAAGLVKALVPAEPWRLFTGPMLHGSIMHLSMNVSAMLALGPVLEQSGNRKLVAPIWLASAFAGSLLSWAALPATSIGASGGLMAIFGFLLVMSWRRRNLLPSDFLNGLLRNLLATALFGALAWAVVDNAAHLGGLLAGGAIGIVIFRNPVGTLPLPDNRLLRALGSVSEASFVALVFYTGYRLLAAR